MTKASSLMTNHSIQNEVSVVIRVSLNKTKQFLFLKKSDIYFFLQCSFFYIQQDRDNQEENENKFVVLEN